MLNEIMHCSLVCVDTNNSKMILSMAKVSKPRVMVEVTKVTGMRTKCMARVHSLGKMEESMKVIMLMTLSVALELYTFQMAETLMDSGLTESKMASDILLVLKVNSSLANGKKAKKLAILRKKISNIK